MACNILSLAAITHGLHIRKTWSFQPQRRRIGSDVVDLSYQRPKLLLCWMIYLRKEW